jgi:glycosyltransferase involved in cell wall biosynthesis
MKRFSKQDLEALRDSGLFDEKWYLEQYPDVKLLGMDPIEHYLWVGAKIGRFSSENHRKNKLGIDPFVDVVRDAAWARNSRELSSLNPTTDTTKLSTNFAHPIKNRSKESLIIGPYFDEEWYISQFNPDEAPRDPLAHFEDSGWRLGLSPNRWFDTLGYVSVYKDVARAGVNPFVHFLKSGRQERRSPNPFFVNRQKSNPLLNRPWVSEYGPISRVLKFNADDTINIINRPSICVHVHAYYSDMIDDIILALKRIGQPFTLLISMPDHEDTVRWKKDFESALPQAQKILIHPFENRGRDVAPWLIHFKDEIRRHKLFFHFHTKRSTHASEHKFWFRFMCHTLIGSSSIVEQIIGIFENDPSIGLLCPGYWPELRRQPNFGAEEQQFRSLCLRMGITDDYAECPDFPAGSFFWCKVQILEPIFALNLNIEDFPEEEGQISGTLAHSIERVMGALPQKSSMQTQFIAIDCPHDQADHQSVDVNDCTEFLVGVSSLKVSVVMPTWNRRHTVCKAIKSALNQSYSPFEILIVDDGSTDGTVELIEEIYDREIESGKIIILRGQHKGVSFARNMALDVSKGDIISYLDSDNTWRRDYLLHVISAYERYPNALSAYTDFLSHDADLDKKSLYNKKYDRSMLVDRNFIDLNVFSHRRTFVDEGFRFDTDLKRLVDWDLIIRVTRLRAPIHIQYVGADYNLDERGLNNITRTVPLEDNLKRVQLKCRRERVYWKHEPLNFVIKCPAPNEAVAYQWGDYHFAQSLCRSLEQLGCKTRIDFLCDWEKNESVNDDVVLVLRGLSRYIPKPGRINLMWLISHPDKVSLDEMRDFDHVFVASHSFTQTLVPELKTKVTALLQCSDLGLFFHPIGSDSQKEHELVFVGNSRRVDRWMPRTCVERGLPIHVYGADWQGRIPDSFIKGSHIPNDSLGKFYSSTKIILNDHWPDMAKEGFVSNRIFDAGLSGALVISDCFQGSEIFFGNVICCGDEKEVEEAICYFLNDSFERNKKISNLQKTIRLNHTFDHRAEVIMRHIGILMSRNVPFDIRSGVPSLVNDGMRSN